MYFWFVIIFILVLDQLSKWMVRHYFLIGDGVAVLGSAVRLTYIENSGAAFGIFSGNTAFLIVVTVLILLALMIYRKRLKSRTLLFELSVACILSGSIGNLIDRIYKGMVTDFIQIGWWPIFNIADMAVCIGVFLFGISAFLLKDEAK